MDINSNNHLLIKFTYLITAEGAFPATPPPRANPSGTREGNIHFWTLRAPGQHNFISSSSSPTLLCDNTPL